jgi:hypothetical protein
VDAYAEKQPPENDDGAAEALLSLDASEGCRTHDRRGPGHRETKGGQGGADRHRGLGPKEHAAYLF